MRDELALKDATSVTAFSPASPTHTAIALCQRRLVQRIFRYTARQGSNPNC